MACKSHIKALEIAATALRRATYNAHGLALAGSSPNAGRILEFMRTMKPGNMVIETTTVWGMRKGMSDLDGIGILIREAVEPVRELVWDIETDGPLPEERVYYIKTLDGREFRWTNASFIAVPCELLR